MPSFSNLDNPIETPELYETASQAFSASSGKNPPLLSAVRIRNDDGSTGVHRNSRHAYGFNTITQSSSPMARWAHEPPYPHSHPMCFQMKDPIRFGLIGTGGVGAYHLSVIESLEKEGLVKLVAATNPVASEAQSRLQARGVQWYTDYKEMLQQQNLDAVTIATPIPLHFEMTQACLDRDLFVYLEKPPVPLVRQLDQLIKADPDNHVNVGFQMIVSKPVQMLKSLIMEGRFGRIQEIRACGCWPRRDSYYNRASWVGKLTFNGEPVFDGPMTNAFAHVVHNIMYLATPEEGFDTPVSIAGELYRARPIESYDTACLRGELASGALFSVAVTHATQEMLPFKISVNATNGSALISDDGAVLESTHGNLNCPESTMDLLKTSYDQFAEFIRGERSRAPTRLSDALGYVLATSGIKISSCGIKDIDSTLIREYHHGEDRGINVKGLRNIIETSFSTGRLFSELGIPWSHKPTPIFYANLEKAMQAEDVR
ncbi:MAG: Gfo/Idh/MocA family protein [Chthoniobacteraceae bacterium]